MFLTEDARQIQDEVMAEIKSALFNIDPKLPAASGSKDTIKDHQESCSSNAQSPRDSETCDLTEVDESTEGDANEESLVPTKMGPSLETHLRISSSMGGSSAGGSTMNDSFVDRMNLSCGSSIGGSSLGTLDSQKYYIGSAHGSDEVEDETSSHFGSHMGDGEEDFGMEDMSRTELMQVVRTLYRELRKADESLSDEKKRRHSREKNLIKLARELKKRKDATTKLTLKMEEVRHCYV